MSEEESENEVSDEESEEEESDDETNEFDPKQKDEAVDKDIALLRNISAYINRTTKRLTKRILREIEENNKVTVMKEESSQTISAQSVNSVPELPPLPAFSYGYTPAANVNIPTLQNRNFNMPLAHYEHMNDAERNRLVNEAISVLLNEP